MAHFQNKKSARTAALIAVMVISACAVAKDSAQRSASLLHSPQLAGAFIKTLFANSSARIEDQSCLSADKAATISSELAAILSKLATEKLAAKIGAECSKASGENGYQDCKLAFYSANKNIEWSLGFTFLGDPVNGKIRLETLGCFQTP